MRSVHGRSPQSDKGTDAVANTVKEQRGAVAVVCDVEVGRDGVFKETSGRSESRFKSPDSGPRPTNRRPIWKDGHSLGAYPE